MNTAHARDLLLVSFRLCMIELWSNKLRSLITSFGIFLGVASLLVNLAFIRALDNNIMTSMEEIGGLTILTVRNREPSSDTERREFARSEGLTLPQLDTLRNRFPYIRAVLPQRELHWDIRARGKGTHAHVMAVGDQYLRAYNVEVSGGRLLTHEDHVTRRQVCLMGQRASNRLFGKGVNPVGREVTINSLPFTVVGAIKTDDEFSWRARQVLLPYAVYAHRFGGRSGRTDEIALELTASDRVDQAVVQLRHALLSMHRGVENFEIEANRTKINEMKAASLGMKVLLVSIAIITLAVGGVSIMNIMFATIGDRIREIGIRKALGARPGDIFSQFIIEAILLCFVGGIPGLFVGMSVTLMPRGTFPFTPALGPGDYIVAVGFTILAGTLSGMLPALGAARMEPVDALRY